MHHSELEYMQKDWFAIFKVKVIARLIWSEYNTVSTISAEVLVLLLPNLVWWFIIINQNLRMSNGKWECCAQGQCHSKFQNVNECPDDIFWIAEPFTARLAVVMHHYEPDCLPKYLFAVIKFKVTVKDHIYNQNMLSVFWSADPFATKLGLMSHHQKIDYLVKRLDCCVVIKVKVTQKVKNSIEFHLDNISSTAEPLVTKLGMVMHHQRPECYARRLVCCL